MTTVMSYIQC